MTMASDHASQPSTSWRFTEALELLASWKPSVYSPPRAESPEAPSSSPSLSPSKAFRCEPEPSAPSGLGDLDRLFDYLGIPHEASGKRTDEVSDSSSFSLSPSASDRSTPPSSLPEDDNLEDFISKSKEVRWTDEADGNNIMRYRSTLGSSAGLDTTPQRTIDDSDVENSTPSRNTRRRPKPRASHAKILHPGEFESEPEYQRPTRPQLKHRGRLQEGSDEDTFSPVSYTPLVPSSVAPTLQLKPASVLWVPPPTPKIPVDPNTIRPIDTLTREEKYEKLLKKLQKRFVTETALIPMKPDQVAREYGGNLSPDGIHVFVDCSNIVIGFHDELKRKRGMNVSSPSKGGVLSWHTLAFILERGRPAARRVLVGSHGSPLESQRSKRPNHMLEAEQCGYEVNILDRVIKTKEVSLHKKRRGNGNGYAATSGYSSGSDGTYRSRKAVAEQGVDEILHMKLLESLIDTEVPSTIVLASGDAAEAEYSGGFMKNVERALKNGWKVELVSWSAGLSKDYQSNAFLGRWKGRFSIILLDDFSEEMLALYTNPIQGSKFVSESFA